MTNTIIFKETEKEVFEVLSEIKSKGFSRSGSLRMLTRVGGCKITEDQLRTICNYAERGLEQYTKVFDAIKEEVQIELEEPEKVKEFTFAEAMKELNESRVSLRVVTVRGDRVVRRFTDLKNLEEIGIYDFDDLHNAKFLEVK